MRSIYLYLLEAIREVEGLQFFAKLFATLATLIIIAVVAGGAFYITRRVLLTVAGKLAKKTKTEWDDLLLKNRVFRAVAHLVPAFILYHTYHFASYEGFGAETTAAAIKIPEEVLKDYYLWLPPLLHKISKLYFILIFLTISNRVLNTAHDIYNSLPVSFHRSIKGYVQLVKILFYFLGSILIISIIINRDPSYLLAGLGTMAAVLLLVFKDTILGFVASIQLSANKMVNIGDWISMPSHNADGTVTDITLNTVKVQNWDKTITTIPTYALVSESFSNWKGMEESGGRRIKRSLNIDMKSVRFCDDAMLKRFEKYTLIRDYVIEKEKELEDRKQQSSLDSGDVLSSTRQTNLGIFRRYLELYLEAHPMIHNDMTFLVRHLQPTERGLPVEIYVFSKDQQWANYEAIQADIFDHILAVLPEFELRVFQYPSGYDFTKILNGN
ncbi:mechanosensitive ion channel [Prolixibacteraceae bacterium JC049]|nr:mechanosensitive ion channel [Prolixibacteraceae bacterium JC049]